MVLERLGNTAAAGAIIAFKENHEDMKAGDYGLLCTFRAGILDRRRTAQEALTGFARSLAGALMRGTREGCSPVCHSPDQCYSGWTGASDGLFMKAVFRHAGLPWIVGLAGFARYARRSRDAEHNPIRQPHGTISKATAGGRYPHAPRSCRKPPSHSMC